MPLEEGEAPRRLSHVTERGFGVWTLMQSVWKKRSLVNELARREVMDLHASQTGGFLWIVVHPLLLFVVYSFLFTFVLKVRIGAKGPEDYTVYLFSGLAPWLFSQDVLYRAANVMLVNITIVKKVMFPMEALVAKAVLASVFAQAALLLMVLLFTVAIRGVIPPSMLLLIVLVPMHLAMLWGLSLMLSSFTPYLRDTVEILRIFLTVTVFLIPVMYLPEMVPQGLGILVLANPFSHLIWCYQDAIYFGHVAHPGAWIVTAIFSVVCLYAGSYVFLRLRHHVASVL